MSERESVYPVAATLLGLLLAGLACGPGSNPVDVVDAALLSANPTYADVAPIIQRACIACHTSEGRAEDGVALDGYSNLFDERLESVCTAIHPGVGEHFQAALQDEDGEACEADEYLSMPPVGAPALTPEEQVTLARWIELGAPQ